jgi:hypothetical protein
MGWYWFVEGGRGEREKKERKNNNWWRINCLFASNTLKIKIGSEKKPLDAFKIKIEFLPQRYDVRGKKKLYNL